MITRKELWIGVLAAVAALNLNAFLPRYEWRDPGGDATNYVRIDRWTGKAQWGTFTHLPGRAAGEWVSVDDLRRYRDNQAVAVRIEEVTGTEQRGPKGRQVDIVLPDTRTPSQKIDDLLREADAALAEFGETKK